jgi:FdhE protein
MMHSKFINSNDLVLERLHKLANKRPDLKDAVCIFEVILPLLATADPHVVPVIIAPEEARSKLEAGLPLLSGIELNPDVQSVRGMMLKLAQSLEELYDKNHAYDFDSAGFTKDICVTKETSRAVAARNIRKALEANTIDIGTFLSHIAAGEHELIETTAQVLCLDTELLWTLGHSALKPAMHAWRRQLAPSGDWPNWQKSFCYICGADALLGELRGNGQTLHLRCGCCGADWRSRRLQCVRCGNEDHLSLRSIYCEDQTGIMRLEACDKCRGYLKVITSFSPTPPELLAIEDLATLHLDYIAHEHGYRKMC